MDHSQHKNYITLLSVISVSQDYSQHKDYITFLSAISVSQDCSQHKDYITFLSAISVSEITVRIMITLCFCLQSVFQRLQSV